MAEPDGFDVGGEAGFDVVLAVADHPGVGGGDVEFLAGEEQGGGVGFEAGVFAGDDDLEAQVVAGEDGLGAGATVARDDRGGDLLMGDPGEELIAAGVEGGGGGGALFVLVEDGVGGGFFGGIHLRDGFEDGAVADAEVAFDGGEVEHGCGECAVHVEEEGARAREWHGDEDRVGRAGGQYAGGG